MPRSKVSTPISKSSNRDRSHPGLNPHRPNHAPSRPRLKNPKQPTPNEHNRHYPGCPPAPVQRPKEKRRHPSHQRTQSPNQPNRLTFGIDIALQFHRAMVGAIMPMLPTSGRVCQSDARRVSSGHGSGKACQTVHASGVLRLGTRYGVQERLLRRRDLR